MNDLIAWPVSEPRIPASTDPALAATALAASRAFAAARAAHGRAALAGNVAMGADGTPTMLVDRLVEDAIAETVDELGVNLLSEEIGMVDNGSAVTLVIDPVDGSANAAAGVPLSAFAAARAVDGRPVESLTCWLDTGRCWHAGAGEPAAYRTSGRAELAGAAISLLRPHPRDPVARDGWWRVAERASRIRILSTTCLEAALVAEGSTDAFADAGSDTHRIVDVAAALVMLPAAGGVVLDVHGRPFDLDPDLTRRWSAVVAATPRLGEQLVSAIRGD